VRARAVVLAGGSVPTPLLLLKQDLANSSGQVGKNLTLHPSCGISALFDDEIDGPRHIPQGYGCDQFLRDGILITAALADVNVAPVVLSLVGRPLMHALERLPHLGALAVMVADATRNGRVWRDVGGHPAITYRVTGKDIDQLHRAMVAAAEICVAAGAKRLYPVRFSMPSLEPGELGKLKRSRPAAGDLSLLSYHPLGTCKMGRDPRTSVVGLDHQTHDIEKLFVVDGSTVPGPLGVNPQLTIMAMATRAASLIAPQI
jgi:hypothetical protein